MMWLILVLNKDYVCVKYTSNGCNVSSKLNLRWWKHLLRWDGRMHSLVEWQILWGKTLNFKHQPLKSWLSTLMFMDSFSVTDTVINITLNGALWLALGDICLRANQSALKCICETCPLCLNQTIKCVLPKLRNRFYPNFKCVLPKLQTCFTQTLLYMVVCT